jgi:hypothetical protein
MFGSRFGAWRDKVDDDTPRDFFGGLPNEWEQIVGDAMEFAQTIVERTVEPLIDAINAMSEGKDPAAAWRSSWGASGGARESERFT